MVPIGNLGEAVGFLSGQVDMDPHSFDLDEVFGQFSDGKEDLVDVKGQNYATRALVIADACGHNVLTLWSISPLASAPGLSTGIPPRLL
jgi:magnesium chelatase family protein